MSSIKIALLASLACAGSAAAADLSPQPMEPMAPVAAPFSWTGFYAGINAGYGGGSFKNPISVFANPTTTQTVEVDAINIGGSYPIATLEDTAGGFVGGGQVGYNYQFEENWVIGAEADIQWSGIKSRVRASINGLGAIEAKTELDWYGTARLRAGYAFDNVLIYATGGLAYGHVKTTASATGLGSISGDDSKLGWAAGGGIEYAINDHWTFKTEYLYVDLGKAKTINRSYNVDGGTVGFGVKSDVAVHTVRAGLNYKF